MFNKINIADVQIEWLNTRCLINISKFARALHRHNGTILNLQEKNILSQIVEQAHKTDDPLLLSIYADLKMELRKLLAQKSLEEKILKFAIPKLSHSDLELDLTAN